MWLLTATRETVRVLDCSEPAALSAAGVGNLVTTAALWGRITEILSLSDTLWLLGSLRIVFSKLWHLAVTAIFMLFHCSALMLFHCVKCLVGVLFLCPAAPPPSRLEASW